MLDIELIENTIYQLENSETNIENCNLLASLYICRENYYNQNISIVDISSNITNSELEVLPTYINYIETKRKYEQFEIVDEMLICATYNLCRDIIKFVSDLYNNAETKGEQALIVKMVNEDLRRVI